MSMETESRRKKVMEQREFLEEQLEEGEIYLVYLGLYKENIEYFRRKGLSLSKVETEKGEGPCYRIKTPLLKDRAGKRNNQTASEQVGMLLFIIFLLFLANQLLMATFNF